jgi:nitrogen-specific signal transduction histidine kinase
MKTVSRQHDATTASQRATPLGDGALRRRIVQLETVNAIFHHSLGPAPFSQRLQRILAYIVSLKELDLMPRAALFLADHNDKRLSLVARYGTDEYSQPCPAITPGRCYCGTAIATNTPQFTPVAVKCSHKKNERPFAHGHYCLPLARHGAVIGVLCLYTEPNHRQNPQIIALLEVIGETVGAIVEDQKPTGQHLGQTNNIGKSLIQLMENGDFSDTTLQSLNHGILICDTHTVLRRYNHIAASIISSLCGHLEEKSLADIFGPENSFRIISKAANTPPALDHELHLVHDTGDEFIFHYAAVKGAGGETIIGITDVTEWKFMQKELEKMNRLSTVAEIASAVAHEVRNPLAGIKIMAQSIEEHTDTEEERVECAQRIIRQVDRLNELLTDFFSYARPVVPKKQPTRLESILAETKPLIINKLVKHKISLIEDFQPGIPEVQVDANQIQQVFLNLFLNAIDAIKQEGNIEIIARVLSSAEVAAQRKRNPSIGAPKQHVLLIFKDNGAGMSRDVAAKVFEPFFTTKPNGAGLGMSIVYRTLAENDASIQVESEKGVGTSYSIIFTAA